MLILNRGIFELLIRPLKWHTYIYIVNCTENARSISLYFARVFLNTKLHHIKRKRIQNLQYFLLF